MHRDLENLCLWKARRGGSPSLTGIMYFLHVITQIFGACCPYRDAVCMYVCLLVCVREMPENVRHIQ